MTGNQTMDYYVQPRHIYSHSRTCSTCHVLVEFCIEDLWDWWHSIYATSLIMPVFMRFQLSWFDSSVFQTSSAIMEILIHCISSYSMEILIPCISSSWIFWSIIYCAWRWPHMSHFVCLFMAIVLLCIRDCYMYLQSYANIDYCTILMDGWFFHLVLHQSTF